MADQHFNVFSMAGNNDSHLIGTGLRKLPSFISVKLKISLSAASAFFEETKT